MHANAVFDMTCDLGKAVMGILVRDAHARQGCLGTCETHLAPGEHHALTGWLCAGLGVT